jgi:hypothetical protein
MPRLGEPDVAEKAVAKIWSYSSPRSEKWLELTEGIVELRKNVYNLFSIVTVFPAQIRDIPVKYKPWGNAWSISAAEERI